MHFLMRLFSVVALVQTAAVVAAHAVPSCCKNAKIVDEAQFRVGERTVQFVKSSCEDKYHHEGASSFHQPPLCLAFGKACDEAKPTSSSEPDNVGGDICTNSCNTNAGRLPPITEDCGMIEEALAILVGGGTYTFKVEPNHNMELSYGTCSIFFLNLGTEELEYNWGNLSSVASGAASSCFPPVMPINSEGLCMPSDGKWAVGISHS